ncbi:transposase [Micromonospora sp. WMMD956]|uniref:transposase n=1 Tax=Micromonospora sp. WMMD956 TaxID=3016108 RepID=UPI002416CDF6|nr:transposase [Micromonospora sp. WMMD956]MDG4820202.1 transposase [Micromonospora sp. WMMD956]
MLRGSGNCPRQGTNLRHHSAPGPTRDLSHPDPPALTSWSWKYPDELCQRAVRLYRESDPKPVIRRLAEQLGVHHEVLRNWIRQAEADADERHDRPTSEMAEENRRLRREVTELRRANEILKAGSAYFAAELDPTRRRS